MSRGPEANFWSMIRKNLPQNCYAWRLENRVSAGMPDVYAIWNGLPLWIELKVIKASAVRLSPQQVAWHTAHSHAGGLSFILVKRSSDRTLFLFEGREARSVASEGLGARTEFRGPRIGDVWEAVHRFGSGHFGAKFGSGSGSGL